MLSLIRARRKAYPLGMSRCPTCKSEAVPRAQNDAFPFCSRRCKAIDLGKWFIGEYRVPGRALSAADGEPRQPDESAAAPGSSGGDE